MNHIVKRAGHTEEFDEKKTYASIYTACVVVHEAPASAELVAEQVTNEINKWLANKHEVTSADIKRQAYKHFKVLNPHAAWIYLHQRNVS